MYECSIVLMGYIYHISCVLNILIDLLYTSPLLIVKICYACPHRVTYILFSSLSRDSRR